MGSLYTARGGESELTTLAALLPPQQTVDRATNPEHLAEACLFLLNSGLRSKSEAVRLDWRWEIAVPELDCSVFLIPGDSRKNEQDHVCVLNSVARSIIERCRGKHPTAVFTYRGKPPHSVNNTA